MVTKKIRKKRVTCKDLIAREFKPDLFDLAPEAYLITDSKGVLIDCNKEAEKLTGYPKKEIVGSYFIKLNLLKKADIARVLNIIKSAANHKTGPDEFNILRKDGEELSVVVKTTPFVINNEKFILVSVRDVTEHKRANDLLLQQNELKELSAIKNKFLMRISHELRHPLVPVVGYAQVMLEENPSSIQRSYLEKILMNANQLRDLINKTLELISFESGEAVIQPVKFEAKSLINSLVSDYSTKAEIKSLKLISNLKGNFNLMLDEPKIKMAIGNIIDNSIKFTESGSVKIDAFKNHKNIIITITDTGRGINSDELKSIFTYRAEDENYDMMYKGLGIGLLLSRHIIDYHKGEIDIKSEVNKGTRVTIKLPLEVKPVAGR